MYIYFLESVCQREAQHMHIPFMQLEKNKPKPKQPCSIDEAVSVFPVWEQVGSFHIVNSDVHVSEGLREEVVNLPGHIQDVAHTDKQTDTKRRSRAMTQLWQNWASRRHDNLRTFVTEPHSAQVTTLTCFSAALQNWLHSIRSPETTERSSSGDGDGKKKWKGPTESPLTLPSKRKLRSHDDILVKGLI